MSIFAATFVGDIILMLLYGLSIFVKSSWICIYTYIYELVNFWHLNSVPLSLFLFNIVLEMLTGAIKKHKEMKHIKIRKEENKLFTFTDETMLDMEKPKVFTTKLGELSKPIQLAGKKTN